MKPQPPAAYQSIRFYYVQFVTFNRPTALTNFSGFETANRFTEERTMLTFTEPVYKGKELKSMKLLGAATL